MKIVKYLVAILAAVSQVNADCMDAPSLREAFQASNYVARLELLSETATLSCGFEVYVYDEDTGDGDYEVVDEFPTYRVLEVLKGNLTQGSSIPIVFDTDTGGRVEVPTSLTEAEDGFLAFLYPSPNCQFPNEEDKRTPLTYSMSECDFSGNVRWDDVSEEDKAFMRANGGIVATDGSGEKPSEPVSTTGSTSGVAFGYASLMLGVSVLVTVL